MAYINVAEWTPDQVTDWLKGLDNSMYKYINSFTNNEIRGLQLLNIRPYELCELGMFSIGHQEIVLDAVEQLRNFHYNLEKENLQFLAMHVATATKNLYKRLAYYFDKKTIETEILNDITRAIANIKPLVGWLDRSPFQGQTRFNELRARILKLGIEMATSAQRDRFVENPVDQIRLTAEKLSKLADYIIQDLTDPMILQPATLNLVTLKKRESELGFNIIPNYHGIHVITDIKYNSPAHISGKIENGDEIIQINYQTVVGWHYKRVIQQLQESPPDVLLTLKKRPKHTKIYGQIYMKPYRLPSKKRAPPYRLNENLPSPRIDLTSTQNYPILLPVIEKTTMSDTDSSSSSIVLNEKPTLRNNEKDIRLYLPKPRAVLQRRNTICGDQPQGYRGSYVFWREIDNRNEQDSPSLRDKSVSFGFGLEVAPRPTTCIDLGGPFKGSLVELKHIVNQQKDENKNERKTTKTNEAKPFEKQTKSKAVKFCNEEKIIANEISCSAEVNININGTIGIVTINDTSSTIQKDDVEKSNERLNDQMDVKDDSKPIPPKKISTFKEAEIVEAVNTTLVNSHNQMVEPTMRLQIENKPPEISPRRDLLQKKEPPIPPPRPSKAAELLQRKLDSLKREQKTILSESENDREIQIVKKPVKTEDVLPDIINSTEPPSTPKEIPMEKHFVEERLEGLELLTPNNSKTLTLKKKNSIFAKRRKIALKSLAISDIQGHLFRRTKDKNGVTYWAKLYFILVESALYGFRDKQSMKANCLIFLSGFTVSLAKEVHSKPHAYKVYHPKKTFYFAAETEQALSQWIEYIKRATLKGSVAPLDPSYQVDTKELYSETDSSDDEATKDKNSSPLTLKKSESNYKHEKTSSPSSTTTKSEKYHISFGTIKKFTHSLPFTSSKSDKEKEREEKKKNSSDTPVPTAQFRSYRKIHGNAGMQLGAVDFVSYNKSTKTLAPLKGSPIFTKSMKISSPLQSTLTHINRLHEDLPSLETTPSNDISTPLTIEQFERSSSQLAKTKTLPFNYMHASNPNLVEFTFQTSKTLDYSQPKVNPSMNFDAQHNLQGFITLKDLMLLNEEAEANNMYANRVNLGVEKTTDRQTQKIDKNRNESQSVKEDNEHNVSDPSTKKIVEKIQRRSLPKTPDYAQSFKTDDNDIIMARSKEGQKLRDFGYEFISGDDANGVINQQQYLVHNPHHRLPVTIKSKSNDRTSSSSTKSKSRRWMNLISEKGSSPDEKSHKSSFKFSKSKVTDSSIEIKSRSDHLNSPKFSFHSHQNPNDSAYDSKKCPPTGLYKLERSQSSAATMTDHTEILNSNRERRSSVDRNATYFAKLSFPSNKPAKERRLLGSPLLHRAFFGRKPDQTVDHEPFSPIENNQKVVVMPKEQIPYNSNTHPFKTEPSQSIVPITENNDTTMEYPPVFEPETYSLCDPNMSLLRRRNVNEKK